MEKKFCFTCASSLDDLREVNSSFDTGTLQIAYAGENRNKTEISKEAFEEAAKTIFNVPVVCNYDRETDTLGGHDMELVKDDDGVRLVNITTPIGCVPESAEWFWKSVTEDDGRVNDYFCVNVLLWKRQEAYKKVKENGVSSLSMEINILSGEDIDNGLYRIDKFEFTAFAIIGVEPCFESASLQLFAKQDFEAQFTEMMRDMKKSFSLVKPSVTDGGETIKLHHTEGGNIVGENNNPTSTSEFALNSNIMDELIRVLSAEKFRDRWGDDYARYIYADHDEDVCEVYCWDAEDWLLYGFRYEINGDAIIINWETKQRKKYIIADFDEGEQPSPFAAVFDSLKESSKKSEDFELKFNETSELLVKANSEIENLKLFKKNVEFAELKAEKESLLSNFSDLNGVEDYEALKQDDAGFDLESIENKCYELRGRRVFGLKSDLDNVKPVIQKIQRTEPEIEEPYNGLFKKYGY